jgi:hypothetical protein
MYSHHRVALRRSRTRILASLVCALLLAIMMGARSPSPLAAFNDGDSDGIDDGYEAELAARFLPEMRYYSTEHCPLPLPGPIIFRLRHPTWRGQPDQNIIAINYIRLYLNDCGPAGHGGDNEPFLVFLRWVDGDWRFDSISATAHWGTGCEVKTASYQPLLWIGGDKHGNFVELGQCDSGTFCNNHCTWNGPGNGHSLYNVGEPTGWLINDLGQVHQTFAGQTVWNDNQFFGGGYIAGQLNLGGFVHRTTPWYAYGICESECNAVYDSCIANGGVPQDCDFERQACMNSCVTDWDS